MREGQRASRDAAETQRVKERGRGGGNVCGTHCATLFPAPHLIEPLSLSLSLPRSCFWLAYILRAAMFGHAPALQLLVQAPGVSLEATSNVSLICTLATRERERERERDRERERERVLRRGREREY